MFEIITVVLIGGVLYLITDEKKEPPVPLTPEEKKNREILLTQEEIRKHRKALKSSLRKKKDLQVQHPDPDDE